MNHRKSTKIIFRSLRFAEKAYLKKFSWLRFQDALGLFILLSSIGGMIFNAVAYYKGWFPAWYTIVATAFCASLLHELEHDLIHKLYFNRKPLIQNFMMLMVWLFRANTINPWFRRKIHLLHHRESGQNDDIEERLVGLGLPWGLKRFLVAVDPMMSMLLFNTLNREIKQFSRLRTFLAGNPMIPLFNALWYPFLLQKFLGLFGVHFIAPSLMNFLSFAAVVYLIPNVVRSTSINIVTTLCHYYGDIERNNLSQQTQVLNKFYFYPLQLFCFNFGSTHIIHHFYVMQPFYLRQMIAPIAHRLFRKQGIRFNDLATIQRTNRFYLRSGQTEMRA